MLTFPEIFLCTDKHKGEVHQKQKLCFFGCTGSSLLLLRRAGAARHCGVQILTAEASPAVQHRLWVHGLREMTLMGSVAVAQRR